MNFSKEDRDSARLYSLKHLLEQLVSGLQSEPDDMDEDTVVEPTLEAPEKPAEGREKAEDLLDALKGEAPEEGSEDDEVYDDDAKDEDMKKTWKRRFGY